MGRPETVTDIDHPPTTSTLALMLGGLLGVLCYGSVLLAGGYRGTQTIAALGLPSGIAVVALLVVASIVGVRLHADQRWPGPDGRLSPASRGRLAVVALPVLLGALLAAFLSAYWQGILRTGLTIGGIFPWADGAHYLRNAQGLIEKGRLDEWGSGRPLACTTWATILALTGQDLRLGQAAMTLLTGACAWFALEQIRRSHGLLASLWTLCLWVSFQQHWTVTVLSEGVGLAFGALGFGLLWRGAGSSSITQSALGLFALTLGSCARPGAMLVLPALLLWLLREHRDAGWPRVLAIGMAAIGAGFALDALVLSSVGDPHGTRFGHAAYFLYGLAAGGEGWGRVLRDHAELSGLADGERAVAVYRLAWARFVAAPWMVPVGMARVAASHLKRGLLGEMLPATGVLLLWQAPLLGGDGVSLWRKGRRWLRGLLGGLTVLAVTLVLLRSIVGGGRLAGGAFAASTFLAVVVMLLHLACQKEPHARLLLAGSVGILLSMLFIDGAGIYRYRVFATTTLFICVPAGLAVARLAGRMPGLSGHGGRPPWVGLSLLGLMLVLAVAAPHSLRWAGLGRQSSRDTTGCSENRTPILLRWTSGLHMRHTGAPRARGHAMGYATVLQTAPATRGVRAFLARWESMQEVHYGYDLIAGRLTWVLLSREADPSWEGRYLLLCGEVRSVSTYRSVTDPDVLAVPGGSFPVGAGRRETLSGTPTPGSLRGRRPSR